MKNKKPIKFKVKIFETNGPEVLKFNIKNIEEVSGRADKCFEVTLPIKESWVFNVYAKNLKEAKARFATRDSDFVTQVCTDQWIPKIRWREK